MSLPLPRYVEVLGAPGVGKTTILHACAGARRPDGPWALDPEYASGGPWDGVRGLKPRGRFVRDHPEFAAFLFRALGRAALDRDEPAAARMFERTQALNHVFAKFEHAAERLRPDQVLIVDEAFVKAGAPPLLNHRHSGETLRETLQRPEMGAAYVHVDAEADLIQPRIVERSKRARSHRGLSEQQVVERTRRSLDSWRRAVERIRRAEVPTLVLDAAEPAEANAEALRRFVEGFAPSQDDTADAGSGTAPEG
ncbi:ATP-binding protein [Egibacter rhizosphaerae]|uniref:ATP-binding protein n=1 Tax=Egibacter rhizosphaerae TaxID=1670831 RepID=A0A411YIK6_9ACTN|nr:ATP-binding protein [Egibacter rhizosphaerae]QBI20916.1 ATP-binding protein [Egibacter rhizosphaerae]